MNQTEAKNEREKDNDQAAETPPTTNEKSQEKPACGCCGRRTKQK